MSNSETLHLILVLVFLSLTPVADCDGRERLILSVTDYVKTFAPPPDWLEKSWDSAKRHGVDKLTAKEIDAEVAAARRDRRKQKPGQ